MVLSLQRPRAVSLLFPQSTHLSEALVHLGYEQLGLLKRGEVTTFWKPYPIRLVNWFMSK